jgi:hypothetical protein
MLSISTKFQMRCNNFKFKYVFPGTIVQELVMRLGENFSQDIVCLIFRKVVRHTLEQATLRKKISLCSATSHGVTIWVPIAC